MDKQQRFFPLNPSKPFFWITVALFVNSCLFLYKINEPTEFPNVWYQNTIAREAGDARSYIDPVEYLLEHGSYTCETELNYMGTSFHYGDYRMPGYSAVYYMLRLIWPQNIALSVLVVLQLLLASISVYYLAKIALLVFGHSQFFYLTFLLYLTGPFVTLYDHILATESFAAAALIFATYFFMKPDYKLGNLVLSGAFITWAIFLRPVLAPVLILFALAIVFHAIAKQQQSILQAFTKLVVFLLPFVIIDGAWVARNYKHHHGFYPLTTSLYYPGIGDSVLGSVYGFLQSYGGSVVGWNSNNEINFFVPGNHLTNLTFPENIYTSKFNFDSLKVVQQMIAAIEDSAQSPETKSLLINETKAKLQTYAMSIKQEKPFLFYVGSRVHHLKRFLLHTGSTNLFEKPSEQLKMVELIFKLYASFIYMLVVVFGVIACVYFIVITFGRVNYMLLGAIGLYLVFVTPLVLKLDEWRYLVPGYPFLLLGSVFIIIKFSRILNFRKQPHHA